MREEPMLKSVGTRGRAVWTEGRLRALLTEEFGQEQVIILTNREPLRHERGADGTVHVRHSTGGVVSAVEPLARSCGAVWIAHGSGAADRAEVDGRNGVSVGSREHAYRLRRI